MGYKLICTLLLFTTSCFNYSFTGSLPSHIQKVAIPLFENNTSFSGVNQDLTNQVVDQFISDNSLQVTSESEADIVISGTIGSIIQRPAILSSGQGQQGETVESYQMVVNVRVKCEDIKNNKVLWEKTLSQFGDLAGGGSIDEQNSAIEEAIDKITQDILNNTLGFW
jgi:hypothetical protein